MPGFRTLSIFGGDTLVQLGAGGFGKGVVPGGWTERPPVRRDVLDIAVTALISDLRVIRRHRGPDGDNVDRTTSLQQGVPYAATR